MDTSLVFPSLAEYAATFPMLMLAVASLVVVFIDAFWNDHKGVQWFTLAVLTLAVGYTKWQLFGPQGLGWVGGGDGAMAQGTAFYGMIRTGGYASMVNLIILSAGLLTVLLVGPYLQRIGRNYGEVYALLLVSMVGMMALGNGANLVSMFVGLETMSVCLYILTGLVRENEGSIESALKYFLLGAFSTGFFLYGIALLYGATGTMQLDDLALRLADSNAGVLFWGGAGLLLVGFLFKVSAAPFHMWTPDVYQGAPTPISGFMATASKTSAFAALILVVGQALPTQSAQMALAVVALLSMVIGNVVAFSQKNVKRMLAYSSIAHAGYILTGIAAGTPEGYAGALYYLLVYTIMNIAAFGVLAYLEYDGEQGHDQTVEALAGAGQRQPLLGVVMAVAMFSLLGFPPLAGFFGKVYVFGPAVKAGLTWLAVAGVLTSAVSAAYYLRVLHWMWMKKPEEGVGVGEAQAVPPQAAFALVACAVLLLLLTFFPQVMEPVKDLFAQQGAVAALVP